MISYWNEPETKLTMCTGFWFSLIKVGRNSEHFTWSLLLTLRILEGNHQLKHFRFFRWSPRRLRDWIQIHFLQVWLSVSVKCCDFKPIKECTFQCAYEQVTKPEISLMVIYLHANFVWIVSQRLSFSHFDPSDVQLILHRSPNFTTAPKKTRQTIKTSTTQKTKTKTMNTHQKEEALRRLEVASQVVKLQLSSPQEPQYAELYRQLQD